MNYTQILTFIKSKKASRHKFKASAYMIQQTVLHACCHPMMLTKDVRTIF